MAGLASGGEVLPIDAGALIQRSVRVSSPPGLVHRYHRAMVAASRRSSRASPCPPLSWRSTESDETVPRAPRSPRRSSEAAGGAAATGLTLRSELNDGLLA